MSRLIDADAITRSTELVKKIVVHDFTPYIKADDLLQFIDKLPTAYDVDKVVEQLEVETDCPNCSTLCADAPMCGFSEMRKQAIEIVKAGGVNG